MKKGMFLFIMVAVTGLALLSAGAVKARAAAIKLTYSNFFPPVHIQSKLAEAWSREVEKRTNGRVQIQYFPNGTLTAAAQCYDGVVKGISDIGFSVLAYTGGRFPVLSAIDLPLGYPSGTVATTIANDFVRKFNPKEIQDTKVMYLHAHGPGLIHTRDKPVRTLEDLKGLKLRGHGTSAKFEEALGAIPVGKPMPETYQMIQKGVVDGAAYPFEANKGWRLADVTKYATAAFSAAYTTTFFVVMNKEKWNALPQDIKEIIEEINKEWVVKHGAAWDSSDWIGAQYFLSKGGTIFGLDPKEAARWEKAVSVVSDEYVAEMKKKGFPNAQEYVDFVKTAVKNSQK